MYSYKNYLAILGFSLAVSVGLQLTLPYPYGFFGALGIFLIFPFILRKMQAAKFGNSFTKGFGYNSDYRKLSKTCMSCGKKEKGRSCSRCGSNSFRFS